MDFNQQKDEIAKIQKEFGDDSMGLLLSSAHADATIMKNEGVRFLNALLSEAENQGEKDIYDALNDGEFVYVTSRLDDVAKQKLIAYTKRYIDSRKIIDNS